MIGGAPIPGPPGPAGDQGDPGASGEFAPLAPSAIPNPHIAVAFGGVNGQTIDADLKCNFLQVGGA